MIIAGRGKSVLPGLLSEWVGILPFLALLLFSVHASASCVDLGYQACINTYSEASTERCFSGSTLPNCGGTNDGTCLTSGSLNGVCLCSSFPSGNGCPSVMQYWGSGLSGGGYYTGNVVGTSQCGTSYGCTPTRRSCDYTIKCSTQAEADSVAASFGPEKAVPPSCQADYQQCVSLGGVWRKVASTSTECSSECNLCNSAAQTKVLNTWNKVCCQQGMAPPDSAQRCIPPRGGSGGGMQSSQFVNNDGNISCGALSTSEGEIIQENAALYKRFCVDHDEYEEQSDTNDVGGSSSSGEGSSSSEGMSSSFETDLGGLYGVLDTIRDTLVKRLTPATEEIRDCLYNFKLCTALDSLKIDWSNMPQDTSLFRVDTAILKYITPMMDSSVKLDSAQLKVLKQLDSLYKLGLLNDSNVVTAVRGVRGEIENMDSSVVRSVRGVEDGIDSLVDSMTLYLGKMPSSVVSSVDSAIGEGYGGVDTSGVEFGWLGAGDSLADSITGGSGYGGLDFAADSLLRDSLEGLGYVCTDSNCCIGSECIEFDSDASIQDSISRQIARYGDSLRAKNESFYHDSVDNLFLQVKDSLYRFNPLGIFDSTLMSTLGASVPNSNTCPDHCSTFAVDVPFFFGTQHLVIDWGLCMGRAVLANGNVLSFLRFIIRIIVAVTCITAVMWNATRIRR